MSLKVTCYKMRFVTSLMKLLERYIIVMLILFMAPVILGKTVEGDLLLYSFGRLRRTWMLSYSGRKPFAYKSAGCIFASV